ncbi:hypothetical protein F5141DRAFT_1212471 [Pisolithus sp. B1]|nr:hypothetical protein F5141DRAFT_1212471 [Pisolithus sp. B1]
MKLFNILKKGLTKLWDQIQDRKAKLTTKLKAGQPISEVDQEWLDGDGNLVDEEQVVEGLDNASLLLREYVKDIDDPFARKLELMLGSFGWTT